MFACLSSVMLLTSCKKDEVIDPRDQIVGTYTGKVNVLAKYSEEPSLGLDDETFEENVTIKIEKNASVKDEINITELDADGNTIYKANAVTDAINGVTFNIPSQTITESEVTYTISGYTNFTLGSSKYDGAYNSNTNILKFGYEGNVLMNGYKIPYLTTYSLTKQ